MAKSEGSVSIITGYSGSKCISTGAVVNRSFRSLKATSSSFVHAQLLLSPFVSSIKDLVVKVCPITVSFDCFHTSKERERERERVDKLMIMSLEF